MLMYDNVKQLIKESRIESMRHLKDIFSSVIKRGLEGEVYLFILYYIQQSQYTW